MTEADKLPSPRIQRSTVIVTDMDRAIDFYCNVLGFDLEFKKQSDSESYSYPVFGIDRDAQIGFAVLGTPDQPRSLGLTSITGDIGEMGLPRRFGLVLNVDDVDAVLSRAEAAGAKIFEEDALVTNDGRTGREVGILDPDGNLAVIYKIMTKPE